ncbi:hypothetical protein K9B35_00215 [Sphingomonas sp. R647]|uniref:hypothetical protein n=1 Tax=Sphingomonas sp. R647 TaxID=2875233 RepID=UPI001CD53ACD|nr:hypothetical protein [Sphingomonas sp. R647]MCA1196378.1 hypothetical protein [Sphingomonas sp. R647]
MSGPRMILRATICIGQFGTALAAFVALTGCRADEVRDPVAAGRALSRDQIESWTCTVRKDWDDHTWSILQEVVHNPADPEYADRKPDRRERTYQVQGSPYPPAPSRIAFMSMSFASLDVERKGSAIPTSYEVELKGPRANAGLLRFEATDGTAFGRDFAGHSRWLGPTFKSNWAMIRDAEALGLLVTHNGWVVSYVAEGRTVRLGPINVPQRGAIESHLASSWIDLDALVAEAPTRCATNAIDWNARALETI